MSCLQAQNTERMERFLRDELSESEVESFETHILDCGECAEELEKLAALGSELARRREQIEAQREPRKPPVNLLWLALAAALTLAIGLLIVSQPWVKKDLVALASIEPPQYRASQLRGSEDKADDWFRTGMDRYLEANYEDAAANLRSALELHPDRFDVAFYLGASELLTGKTESAVESLEKVIGQGDTPYLEEALFLRAQAYLVLGDAERAAGDLRSILELDGDWGDRARVQLEQLEAWSKGEG